ncbi:hypothetical protein HMSSN036_83990 [Paenibacillus macerans]|nr:hypothetical protein HMSSN036_83990 [Paenibacillus macerans]
MAWIPLALAIALDLISLIPSRPARWGLMLPAGLIWLFFYPNAAYLITDMLHPFNRYPIPETGKFWLDMSFWDHLFTLFFVALLGLALASVSLASVHQLVRKAWGAAAGWMFAIAVLLLSSFGIYLGRFIRWNSWDLLRTPHVCGAGDGGLLRRSGKCFACAGVLQVDIYHNVVLLCRIVRGRGDTKAGG